MKTFERRALFKKLFQTLFGLVYRLKLGIGWVINMGMKIPNQLSWVVSTNDHNVVEIGLALRHLD
jgi:hypothetical protein